MSKKVVLPRYEQMIVDVAQMPIDQLEQIIRIAKATLAQKRPRVRKPKAVAEKAS